MVSLEILGVRNVLLSVGMPSTLPPPTLLLPSPSAGVLLPLESGIDSSSPLFSSFVQVELESLLQESVGKNREGSSIIIKLSRPAQFIVRVGSSCWSGLHGGKSAIPPTLSLPKKVVSDGSSFNPDVDLASLGSPAPSKSMADENSWASMSSCTTNERASKILLLVKTKVFSLYLNTISRNLSWLFFSFESGLWVVGWQHAT